MEKKVTQILKSEAGTLLTIPVRMESRVSFGGKEGHTNFIFLCKMPIAFLKTYNKLKCDESTINTWKQILTFGIIQGNISFDNRRFQNHSIRSVCVTGYFTIIALSTRHL